jgi:hypothetical protein
MWQQLQVRVAAVRGPLLRTVKRLCYVVLMAVVVLALFTPESSGPDSLCQWPRDSGGRLDLRDSHQAQHLGRDARKAEDLAIRYADGHARPGTSRGYTMGAYRQTLNRCEAELFLAVAEQHNVTPEEVRNSLDKHRNVTLDALVMLFAGLLYVFFVDGVVRRIWQRFPPKEDGFFGLIATAIISLVVSLLGVVLGEWWTDMVEYLRIGYGHLVDRDSRIPWGNHLYGIFAVGIFIFWLLSWRWYRESASDGEKGSEILGLSNGSCRSAQRSSPSSP